jgi:hypothetical protein
VVSIKNKMENKNNSEEGTCMTCGAGGAMKGCMGSRCCGHGYGKMRLFYLLRILVTLIILIIVFWCGFRLGTLRGSFTRGYYNYPMMMQGGYSNVSGGQTGGIMPYGAGRQGTSTFQ